MPKGLVKTKTDEKYWSRAKEIVRRNKNKPEDKFTDKDWALVNGLFGKFKNNKKK